MFLGTRCPGQSPQNRSCPARDKGSGGGGHVLWNLSATTLRQMPPNYWPLSWGMPTGKGETNRRTNDPPGSVDLLGQFGEPEDFREPRKLRGSQRSSVSSKSFNRSKDPGVMFLLLNKKELEPGGPRGRSRSLLVTRFAPLPDHDRRPCVGAPLGTGHGFTGNGPARERESDHWCQSGWPFWNGSQLKNTSKKTQSPFFGSFGLVTSDLK